MALTVATWQMVTNWRRRRWNPRAILTDPKAAASFAKTANTPALHGRCILAVLIVISCHRWTLICNESSQQARKGVRNLLSAYWDGLTDGSLIPNPVDARLTCSKISPRTGDRVGRHSGNKGPRHLFQPLKENAYERPEIHVRPISPSKH